MNDVEDADRVQVITAGEVVHGGLACRKPLPDETDIQLGQFRIPPHLTALEVFGVGLATMSRTQSAPPLLCHISQVVPSRAEEQVRFADTTPNVAMVASTQAIRNRAMHHLISEAMCRHLDEVIAASDAKATIPVGCAGGRPKPAIASLVNVRPESLLIGSSCHASGIGAVGEDVTGIATILPGGYLVGGYWEGATALSTNEGASVIMGLHSDSPIQSWGATPRAVASGAGAFACPV